jgi:acyl carrier protein
MPEVQQLDDDIRHLVADILEREPSQIDPEARLVEDLGMDSMMALEIVASIERKYRVKLPEAELANVKTLQRVIELAKRYVH